MTLIFAPASLGKTVSHIIVFYDGKAEVTFIDSMDNNKVYCTNKEDTQISYPLNQIYFMYNDFGKIFYISSSLQYRMDYIEKYGGTLISVNLDTFKYKTIEFNRNIRNSMVYITTVADSFIAVPLLNVYQIDTDLDFLEQSAKKGFLTATGVFLFSTGMEIILGFMDQREPGRNLTILSSVIWQETKDLLPMASVAGIPKTGVTYQSLTFFTPVAVIGWMVYDYFFEWKSNYFRPLTLSEPFPKTMKVVNLRTLISKYIKR